MNAHVPLCPGVCRDEETAVLARAMQQSVLWLVLEDVVVEMLGLGVPAETVRSMTERALRNGSAYRGPSPGETGPA